jgi:hypothetical protein
MFRNPRHIRHTIVSVWLLTLFIAFVSVASGLTTAQLQALKTDITVTKASVVYDGQTLLQWWNAGDDQKLADFYNQAASPAFWVWKTRVSKDELTNGVGPEGTTFTWVGNGFITRSAGEQAAWRELFSVDGTVDPSQANVRQAFADIFSGTGNAAANRTHLLAMSRRLSTYGEALYATGTGSTAAPATLTFRGQITGTDVGQSRFV